MRFANAKGAKASLTFKGTAVSWIGPVGPTRGKAKVWIDGKYVKTVSTFSRSFKAARVLFKVRWKHPGTHRITISVAGTHGHPTVAIDSLVVRTSASAARVPVTKPKSDTATPKPATKNVPQGTPKVLLSNDTGPAGTKTTLSLSGFAGGSTGAIDFDGSTDGMPTYTTASNGTAKVTMTVPADAGVGPHDINTRGPNGDSLMTRTFDVTDPTATLRRRQIRLPPIRRRHQRRRRQTRLRPIRRRHRRRLRQTRLRPIRRRHPTPTPGHSDADADAGPDTRSDTCSDACADARYRQPG